MNPRFGDLARNRTEEPVTNKKKSWKTGFTFNLPRGDVISLQLARKVPGSQMTVGEAWSNYEPITKRDKRSWKADISRAKHLIMHLGQVKVSELTKRDVESYRSARFKEVTCRGTNPTPCTLNHEIRLLRVIINHAVSCGDLEKNPIAGIRLLRENNVRATVINEQQLSALVKEADSDLKPILIVAYDTGMRKSEILKLRWSQVDLHEGVVLVTGTKTDEPRSVYLTQRAKQTLHSLPRSISGYVFVNPKTNKPWVDIKKKWNKAREAAGIKEAWFHDHRRSFVTNARRRGIPESEIMKLTGHRTRSTFDRYNLVSEDELKRTIRKFEKGQVSEILKARNQSNAA